MIYLCKTQNSGLHSKEEKTRDPINQPSRCNMQGGLLSVAQMGDSDLLGGRAPQQQIGRAFYMQKTHTISILHTGYKVIGYAFAKQSDWYKLRGLHVYKAILLAQTSRAFVQTSSNSIGTNGMGFCSNLGARGLFSSLTDLLLGAY